MKKTLIIPCLLFVVSCASIPKNASVLSSSVNQGIERLQAENEKIIKTLADVERAILDDKWDYIYDQVESKYKIQENIASGSTLTRDQRIDIATGAAAVREELLEMILDKENVLILKSKENSLKVITINKEIQNYLLSIKKYDEATQKVSELTNKIIGVNPSEVLGTIENNLQNAINQYLN